jgi:hypothetical protein
MGLPCVMKKHVFSLLLTLFCLALFAQQPTALVSGIEIKKILTVKTNAVRVAFDSTSGFLHYNTAEGNIYRIVASGNTYKDSLVYTASDHGVDYLMGMVFSDSTLYLSGNIGNYTPYTICKVVKGKLNNTGNRTWTSVAYTDSLPTADRFDHLLSGTVLNPKGDSILFCIGSRGDHGEVQNRYGQFPGVRNLPLTTVVLRIPVSANNLQIKNDSLWLAQSGFLYASGARNYFDMAYDAGGNLFALENSGDRDHNEEMNWLRAGRHYGFPWVMGETVNVMQFPGYNITTDKLLPKNSWGRQLGIFQNDSTFPPPPAGLVFEYPVENLGPDADRFKDSTGAIHDASDEGKGIRSFTAHRSPLGLVFDNKQELDNPFKGDAFMLSYTKGNTDSTKVFFPENYSGPFLDPSEDLCHLQLQYHAGSDNFQVHTTRIVSGFRAPTDAELVGKSMYVIENHYDSTMQPALWEITFTNTSGIVSPSPTTVLLYPNPTHNSCDLQLVCNTAKVVVKLTDITGKEMAHYSFDTRAGQQQTLQLPLHNLPNGVYACSIINGDFIRVIKLLVQGK